jgi:hypothetical protein
MSVRWLAVSLLTALVLLAAPSRSDAAVCADFANQAAAQKAANTRDADGDGILCEELPCPCMKPGGSGGGSSPSPSTPATTLRLGPSILLGNVTRRSGCRVRGPLPDRRCTPGARFKDATKARVCQPGYSSRVRHVTDGTKTAVYRAYGIRERFDGRDGEVDHLVPLELGGSNVRANLFPEAATPVPGAHEKDRLENRLHVEVCAGQLRLRKAQRLIARDWVAAYRARFG